MVTAVVDVTVVPMDEDRVWACLIPRDLMQEKGQPSALTLDPQGIPVTWELQAWGSTVRLQRC